MTDNNPDKFSATLRRLRKVLSRARGLAGTQSGRLLRIVKSSAAASGSGLAKLARQSGKTSGSLLRTLAALTAATAILLGKLIGQSGKAAAIVVQMSARLLAKTIDALPKLLKLAVLAARALFHFSVYIGQTLAALWDFLLPYLRRLYKIVRSHMLASAVTATGLVAIVILLDSGEPEPVDERTIPIEQRPKVTVAALLSLTGQNAAAGIQMLRGYRIAAEALNQDGITVDDRLSSLELIIYDDESDPNRAGELAEQIAKEHDQVRALLAPYSSLVARPAAIAAARHALPVLAPAASAAGFGPALPDGVMLMQAPPAVHLLPALELLFNRAEQQGIEAANLAIALAWQPDPHSAAVAAGFSEVLARRGLPPPQLINLAADASQFAIETDAASQADALFVAGYGAGAARIIEHLQKTGRRPPIIALTHCALGKIGSIAPRIASGALCLRHWQPEARYPGRQPLAGRAFVSGYQLRHGRQPTHRSAAAAAAILVIADALRRVENDQADDLQQALAATDLATFYGPIRFNARGINDRKPMIIAQLQFGKYVPVWPAAAAAGDLVDAGSRLAGGK